MKSSPKTTPRRLAKNAAPTSGTPGQVVARANKWRDQYNPLRSLTLARAVQMFEALQRGDIAELMWTYRFIERRHPVLRAGIQRRRASLLKLDWEIKTVPEDKLPPGSTPAQAEAQAVSLRNAYDSIDNLKDAIRHLALAEFRGFSVIQKHRADGETIHLECLNQWNFSRDGLFGDWFWNPDAQSTNATGLGEKNRISDRDGAELPRADFVIREVESPINEIGLVNFIRRNLSTKDWDAFVEMFGLPGCIITMPANVPPDKADEYETAAKRVAESSSGAIPNGATATFPTSSVRGSAPFKEHMQSLDEDLVLAITCGKLTMLTESGSGTLAGGAHQESFDDIAQSEAAEISEVFQRDFDAEILRKQHGEQPPLAYFVICAEEKEDIKQLVADVAALRVAGFKTDAEWLAEKTGYQISEVELPAPTGGFNSQQFNAPRVTNRDDSALPTPHSAIVETLTPLLKRLEAIGNIDDADIQRAMLEKFLRDEPALREAIKADDSLAKLLNAQVADELFAAAKIQQSEIVNPKSV